MGVEEKTRHIAGSQILAGHAIHFHVDQQECTSNAKLLFAQKIHPSDLELISAQQTWELIENRV